MLNSQMKVRSIIRQPSAFIPVAMSLTALALVVGHVISDVASYGVVVREADEGTLAHLWQLLMAGQVPVLAFFAIRWLPRAPRQTVYVLLLQTGAALASIALVFFLHL